VKKVSIIIPAYNEEGNIKEIYNQIKDSIKNLEKYKFEILFVENGSTDKTFSEITKLQVHDKSVICIKLSRNFQMDGGIAAGLDFVKSEAAIIMTANLQDDPKLIPTFITHWEEGYDHVYGIVKSRPGKSIIRKINSKIFYKLINKLTNKLVPIGVSDYRLIDKKVIDAVRKLTEVNRFYRGFFAWVGFKSIGVEFERQERYSGKSHAKTLLVLNFAIKGILSFSTKPLRISVYLTIITSFISFLILFIQIYNWFNQGVPFDGFGTIIGIMLLFISIIFLILSIISEYISLIYEETKKRPHYVVEKIS
jgi:glycosyltransferase involved in cell wall biosynthesis